VADIKCRGGNELGVADFYEEYIGDGGPEYKWGGLVARGNTDW